MCIRDSDKLEPRFKATILYNGATWKGRTIASYVNGTDGWAAWKTDAKPEGRSTTGYYLRKLVDETHSFTSVQASTQPVSYTHLDVYKRQPGCSRISPPPEHSSCSQSCACRICSSLSLIHIYSGIGQ